MRSLAHIMQQFHWTIEQLVAKFDHEIAHMAANLVSDPPVFYLQNRKNVRYFRFYYDA